MSTATIPGHRELADSISADSYCLADYRDARMEYERLLKKLDEQAAWFADEMPGLRLDIAKSKAGSSSLSLNNHR